MISDAHQSQVLTVASVEPAKDEQSKGKHVYEVKYTDGEVRRIELANDPEGSDAEKLSSLKARASQLPDASVEQNFLSDSSGDKSKFFTVRTTEKEIDLVQAAIDRLFREGGNSLLSQTKLTVTPAPASEPFAWNLTFTDGSGKTPQYASEGYIRTLLDREFRAALIENQVVGPFRLQGTSDARDGRYSDMKLTLSLEAQKVSALDTKQVLADAAKEYNQRPQPERLETFDATLAGETRGIAPCSQSCCRGRPFSCISGSASATGLSGLLPLSV